MIDIQQLTSLISVFRVETEKSAIKRVQCQTCLNIAEREQIMQREHLTRDCRLAPSGHRRPVGHRYQRDRVQRTPLLDGHHLAVPVPLWHPVAQRQRPQQRHPRAHGP